MRVLIVDDDRDWVTLLQASFRTHGFEVLTAFDGVQATQQVFQSCPDVIVLDVHMPGGTGLDALRRIKMSTKTSKIPVVVVSGSEDDALPAALEKLGAAHFIKKPATTNRVREAVEAVLTAR